MLVRDIIDDLKMGELSNHGMFSTELSEENTNKLLLAINSGLLALYTRFPLLYRDITIRMYSYITQYRLCSEYARTNKESKKEPKYIIDSELDPFTDDVIRIESVHNEIGSIRELNSLFNCSTVLTPAMDVIEIPNPIDNEYLSVLYRAKHPVMKSLLDKVILPEHLKSALLSYIAYKIYSGSSDQLSNQVAVHMLQLYDSLCTQTQTLNLANEDENPMNCQFDKGGWV